MVIWTVLFGSPLRKCASSVPILGRRRNRNVWFSRNRWARSGILHTPPGKIKKIPGHQMLQTTRTMNMLLIFLSVSVCNPMTAGPPRRKLLSLPIFSLLTQLTPYFGFIGSLSQGAPRTSSGTMGRVASGILRTSEKSKLQLPAGSEDGHPPGTRASLHVASAYY